MVVIVFGLPGSGKSFFAGKLAQKIGAEYFNSDQIRKEIFSERTYSNSEKLMVYKTLLEKMKESIVKEKDVVLDATFYKKEIREAFINYCKGKIAFIEVWAKENTIMERLRNPRSFSEADSEVYQLLKQHWEPLDQPHLKLESTNANIDLMLQRAIDYLR